MRVQEVPTAIALDQSISKAQTCQDIFRFIMNDKTLTRIQIMEYILNEAEQYTTLSQSLLTVLNDQEKARIEAQNKINSGSIKGVEATEIKGVADDLKRWP